MQRLYPLLLTICMVNSQQTITCGQTRTGSRESGDEIEYTFTASSSYSQVYLEGCESTHDIWLEIKDENGVTIADADDQFSHFDTHETQQDCGNDYAGDITIPGAVVSGEEYVFIIKGFQTSAGDYSVTLICEQSNGPDPTPQPTPIPISSNTPTNPSISCGETRQGTRSEWQEIRYDFVSDGRYSEVYLEGCDSNYDLFLAIENEDGFETTQSDDGQYRDDCSNDVAGDIIIPDDSIQIGDLWTFVISGYDVPAQGQSSTGTYSVTLYCQDFTPTPSPSFPPIEPSECGRHREPWHLLSDDERDLYINGFKELNSLGRTQIFTGAHQTSASHGDSAFLPWHRYFLWELETQFRNLGDEYECFSLPYWDWTYDIEQNEYDISNYHILNSGLSGDGFGFSGCVTGDFASSEYSPLNGNCLIREVCNPSTDNNQCNWGGSSASQLISILTNQETYGNDYDSGGYRSSLEGNPHGWAHTMIGGGGQLGLVAQSPDDPIFYLLHGMVDFQYALWQDCRDHDEVDNDDITWDMYGGGGVEEGTYLNGKMEFGALEDESWAYVNSHDILIRDVHDIQDWDVSYDIGNFFERGEVENNNVCSGNINENWFKDITRRRRRLSNNKDTSKYGEYSHDVFEKLYEKVGGKKKSLKQNKELFDTWSEMNCEYLQIDNKCVKPKYYDDCSAMERSKKVGYNGYYDINITLQELIEKVSDYPCMIETRKKYYIWARDSGKLYDLCSGTYDTWCNKDSENEKGQRQCLSQRQETKRKNARKKSIKSKTSLINQVNNNNLNDNFDDNFDDNFGDNFDDNFDENYNSFYGNDKKQFTELQRIVMSGIVNGIIMTIVLLIFICCYLTLKQNGNLFNKTHKYDIVEEASTDYE